MDNTTLIIIVIFSSIFLFFIVSSGIGGYIYVNNTKGGTVNVSAKSAVPQTIPGTADSKPKEVIIEAPTKPSCEQAKQKYLDKNKDVVTTNIDPWIHYLSFGRKEGRIWDGEPCYLKQATHHGNDGSVTGKDYCLGLWETTNGLPKLLYCDYGLIDKASKDYKKGDVVPCEVVTHTPTSYRCYR